MFILFIVTSFWAYGELLIAVEFAKRAQDANYQPIFLIPPSHERIMQKYPFKSILLIPHGGSINRAVLQDIEHRYAPALVVLADFLNYHFCDRHYGLTPQDLTVFSGKIGTFNDFGWELTRQKMDTYGFRAKGFDTLSLDTYDFALSPCPLNNPRLQGGNHNNFLFSQLDQPPWQDETSKAAAREALGIPPQQKVVLTTTATWQHTYKAYSWVEAFVNACNRMFERLLLRLEMAPLIFSVGPATLFTESPPPRNFHQIGQLHPADFQNYLLATDGFLSNNVVSSTLAKVVLSGVPAVVLSSSFYKRGKSLEMKGSPFQFSPFAQETLSKVGYSYPFRMFPVGWYDMLDPLMHANPDCDELEMAELFDEEESLQTIQRVLQDAPTGQRLKAASRQYLHVLSELPQVDQILAQLVESSTSSL